MYVATMLRISVLFAIFFSVELLLHFFKFYSDFKPSEEVVAIHCPPEKVLSPSEAKALASTPQAQGYKIRPFGNKAPFIIQDPFEFDHNVCKVLSPSHFSAFIYHIRTAAQLLASKSNILPLFDTKEYQTAGKQLYNQEEKLVLNKRDLKVVFKMNPAFSALRVDIENLDLKDSVIHESVSFVTLKAITDYLKDSFDFNCSPGSSTEDGCANGEDDVDMDDSNTEKGSDMPENIATSANSKLTAEEKAPTPLQEYVDGDKEGGYNMSEHTVNQKPSLNSTSEEISNEEASGECKGEESLKRKRAHGSSDDDEDETKRVKKGNSKSPETLDILRQLRQDCQSSKFMCTAMSDTWTHRRQRRRKLEQERRHRHERENEGPEEKMDTSELTNSLPSLPPLLRMTLFMDTTRAPLVVIKISQLPPLHVKKFKSWFAVINKDLHFRKAADSSKDLFQSHP